MTAYFVAPRVASGPGAIEQLSALGAHRAALVVDAGIAADGRDRRLSEELAKAEAVTETFAVSGRTPTVAEVDALGRKVAAFGPDWIIALGGGGTIDAAKAAWIRYAQRELELESITPLVELRLRSVASFVAVPTTSGSGSDAAWTAILRSSDGAPIEVASRELVPDWSLLDPSFPATMPPLVTVDTAAEAVGNALEAVGSEWSNPWSDALARDALATFAITLPTLHKHPEDLAAREAIHHAATMAGLAASNAQRGAAHALALALGPEVALSHGRLLGVLLPYVAEFNYPSAREKYETLSRVLAPGAGRDRSAIAEKLRALWLPWGMPTTLAEAGVPGDVLGPRRATVVARARASTATAGNPRVPSAAEYERLLARAYEGGSVTF
ncbi:MAG: iron-containing alcohol dehydrogenase [Thermoplasmata archaeon]|nr:iron-containing alcohol dehydrogenase [Thermoplasmata archaeon]